MILWNAKEQVEAYAKDKIQQLIVTVPPYFTENERVAIANATEIAGLKLLAVFLLNNYFYLFLDFN